MAGSGYLLLGAALLASSAVAAPAESCAVGSPGCAVSPTAEALARDASGREPAGLSLLQDGTKRGTGMNGLAVESSMGGNASRLVGNATGARAACPPPGVKPIADFDVNEWIRKSWYAVEQVPVPFQPNPLLCVTATYNLATCRQRLTNVPFFFGDIILVSNWQQNGAAELCGSVVCPKTPSALKVAPCFLPFPRVLAGDYWVIHVEANPDGTYRWGLVSSGPPEQQASDGCVNPAGTWIFSRAPAMAEEDLLAAKAILKNLGFSLSALVPVKQAGCTYEGAPLK